MADETEVPTGGRAAAEVRMVADSIRSRLDLLGKALAGIATTGTGAVGLTKVGDLFPTTGDRDLFWAFAAVALLALAGGAAVGIAVRLMQASDSVVIEVDLTQPGPGLEKDLPDVERIFSTGAARFGYTTLLGLQERERVLRKAAGRALDDDEQKRRTALADEVKAEIEQALARAQLTVIRRRATRAVNAWPARFMYAAVIVGLLGFSMSADYVMSSRTDAIKVAKDCAEAREAKATADDLLRTDCEPKAAEKKKDPVPPTLAEVNAGLVVELSKAYESCVGQVIEDAKLDKPKLSQNVCTPLATALASYLPKKP